MFHNIEVWSSSQENIIQVDHVPGPKTIIIKVTLLLPYMIGEPFFLKEVSLSFSKYGNKINGVRLYSDDECALIHGSHNECCTKITVLPTESSVYTPIVEHVHICSALHIVSSTAK